jgi:hypothetical protein
VINDEIRNYDETKSINKSGIKYINNNKKNVVIFKDYKKSKENKNNEDFKELKNLE